MKAQYLAQTGYSIVTPLCPFTVLDAPSNISDNQSYRTLRTEDGIVALTAGCFGCRMTFFDGVSCNGV